MQRLISLMVAFALVFAMVLNVALFVQNRKLRQQVTAAALQLRSAQPNEAQTGQIGDLKQQLERAEQDRIKATREATSLRGELSQLQGAAQERDTLKSQVEQLQQEVNSLRNEVSNLQSMNDINGKVVSLRGLVARSNVPRTFMNHEDLRAYLTDAMAREFPPEAEQRHRAVLRALDMDVGEADLRQAEIDDMVKNILGFYDHDTKQLVVVTERATMGVRDRVTYAHEFTHSLQDQHYDLQGLFARAAGNADYEQAIRALVEGDATLTMSLYAHENLNAMDIANYKLEQIQELDLSGIFSGGSGPLVESAAAFPYVEGTAFVGALYEAGDWQAVEQAFANPPRSTEQVLHPEKYYNGDEPLLVQLPDLGAAIGGGWQVVAEDTLGELYMRIYLEHFVPFDKAVFAGMGWGGDRYQVLGDAQGRGALALRTVWDSTADADEFFSAYGAFVVNVAGGNPTTLQSDPGRIRWQLADRQFYLSRVGNQVLVLHAPDGPTLDALLAQLPGF